VDSVVRLSQAGAEKEGVRIVSRIETRKELGGAAVSAVRVALSNLLQNALQATPAGGEIVIRDKIEGDVLVITVQDSGKGVSEDLRQRIWEPFFTTRQRGTGLGLAIVRKRMQEAGGTARLAASAAGAGAIFELRVPMSADGL
jgi:signal transduction histidine kinase